MKNFIDNPTQFDYRCETKWERTERAKKMTFESKNLQFSREKLSEFELKCQKNMQNLIDNRTEFDWRWKSRWKWRKRAQKSDIWKGKFENSSGKNSVNSGLNDRREYGMFSAMQRNSIEVENQGENGEKEGAKKRHLKVKIWEIWRKFCNFKEKNSLNSNDRRKCRIFSVIQRNSIEDANQGPNGKKERKKTTFESKNLRDLEKIYSFKERNCLNSNDRRKCRIFSVIQRNSTEDANQGPNGKKERKKTTFESKNLRDLEKIYNFKEKNCLNSR